MFAPNLADAARVVCADVMVSVTEGSFVVAPAVAGALGIVGEIPPGCREDDAGGEAERAAHAAGSASQNPVRP